MEILQSLDGIDLVKRDGRQFLMTDVLLVGCAMEGKHENKLLWSFPERIISLRKVDKNSLTILAESGTEHVIQMERGKSGRNWIRRKSQELVSQVKNGVMWLSGGVFEHGNYQSLKADSNHSSPSPKQLTDYGAYEPLAGSGEARINDINLFFLEQ